MVVTAVSQEGIKATAKTAKELGAQLADDVVQAAEGAAATAGGRKVGAQFADDVVQGGVGERKQLKEGVSLERNLVVFLQKPGL